MDQEEIVAGKQYGWWTAIEKVERKGWMCEAWKCVGKCGHGRTISAFRILKYVSDGDGDCACRNDNGSPLSTLEIHNQLYSVWHNIKSRCLNKNNPGYKDYGGRGIGICDEWKDNYRAFYDYVSKLDHYGEPGRSLDRIDNDGGYYPGNVRWATAKEQANNRRNRGKKDAEKEKRFV